MSDVVVGQRRWWVDELVAIGVALLAGLPLLLGRAYSTDDSVVLGLPFLAIVQRAVEAHRGMVLCDSAPERGTTFTIFFPARRAAEAAA